MTNKKDEKKYQLSIVNDGKPFTLEKWTVGKNKKVLELLAKEEEDNPELTEEDKDVLYQDYVIIVGLDHVEKLKRKDLEELHPMDKRALFTSIIYCGREGISVKDAGAGKKGKTK